MSAFTGVMTVVAAFIAALLLVYASFDVPVPSTVLPARGCRNSLSRIREAGLWAAIVALVGAYLTAFLM